MGKLSGFDTIDVRTSAVTAWPASRAASRHWRVAAMDPDRQLVAVVTEDWSKTLIVDYSTGKVLKSRKNSMASGSSPGYFAEHGKTLCSAASPQGEFSDHPTCRDVDTGKTIAELKGVPGGRPADASAAGSRMVVTKLNYFPSQQGMTYSGTVVWDFRSGAEIAAWAASDLQVGPFSPDLPLGGGWDVLSSAVAISSSGRYVALQLGEDVQIYELP
jgi:hypothetical protein